MAEHHGLEHHVFRQLARFGFDHQHGVVGAGDDEVERGVLHLVDRRVELQRAADHADACGADRAHEGDAREGKRRRCRDHRQDVGIVLEVMRQNRHDDLGVVAVAGGKQRPDRAVDQAGDQRLLLRGTSLALEIAAWDAARGESLFLVVDGEREEVLPRLGCLGADHGGEHGGLAVRGQHGAIGLTGDTAGLEHELAPGPVQYFAVDVEHACLSLTRRPQGVSRSPQQDCEELSKRASPRRKRLDDGRRASGGERLGDRKSPPLVRDHCAALDSRQLKIDSARRSCRGGFMKTPRERRWGRNWVAQGGNRQPHAAGDVRGPKPGAGYGTIATAREGARRESVGRE